MRCQLEAYKNEVEIVRSDLKLDLQAKEQQLKLLEEEIKTAKEKDISTYNQLASDRSHMALDERSAKLISKSTL